MHIYARENYGGCVLQWPIPLPDETLYSLIARVAKLNGIADALALCNQFSLSPSLSVMDCRLAPEILFSKNDLPASLYSMVAEMTAVRAAAHLAEAESSISNQILVLSDPAQGGLCRWRICPVCAKEDIAQFGVAYWHRQHQLPCSLICANHGAVLERFEIGRAKAHERLFLPSDLNGHRLNQLPAGVLEQREFWFVLARLGADALNDKAIPYSPAVVLRGFRTGMRQAGLITSGGSIRKKGAAYSFAQKLSAIRSQGALPRHDSVARAEGLFHGIVDSTRPQPLARLLLVYWLFGSWSVFKELCRWEQVLSLGDVAIKLAPGDVSLPLLPLEKHRAVCLEYKATHENPVRADFLMNHQRSHRWLLNYDRQWLDSELPLPLSRKSQLNLFD
ncbi:TniQ family protein [Dechloromonas denitrificans]|uniref:TniQ family protein n=1 Tax=Dechloromonas denitrificans TaxID=281362 RepID=UPI001CF8C6C3|nr:TniQ family protein [Dechloromonas denitrificans]UCV11323.1 TniQ family protein [Dechloromonas denitrificans]